MASFLSGLLGPGLTAASQAIAGRQGGEIQGYLMKRDEEAKDQDRWLKEFIAKNNARNIDSEIFSRDHPKPIFDRDRGVTVDVEHGTSSPVAGVTPKPHAPVEGSDDWLKDIIKKADAERIHGYHAPQYPTITVLPGADGKPPQGVETHGAHVGQTVPIPDVVKTVPGGGGGGRSLTPEAMQAMYDQAQHADQVMRQYENDYRAGKVKVGTVSQSLGAGSNAHSTGIMAAATGLEAAASNKLLGLTDKRYQEYLTAQKRFGNIMGNLMSKRYSEYQGTLDTQLAGLSAEDAMPTLDLKQSYRADLLKNRPAPPTGAPLGQGHSGASPTGGDIDMGKTSKTPSATQRQRANTDPKYKEFLIDKGYKF